MLSSRLQKNIQNSCLVMAVLLLGVFVMPSVIGIFLDKEAAREANEFVIHLQLGHQKKILRSGWQKNI